MLFSGLLIFQLSKRAFDEGRGASLIHGRAGFSRRSKKCGFSSCQTAPQEYKWTQRFPLAPKPVPPIDMKALTKDRKRGTPNPVNSAGTKRPKRSKSPAPEAAPIPPALMDEVIGKRRGKPGELLGILEDLQVLHPHQFLPAETLEYVAEKLGVPVSQVFSVATFYAFFNLQPQGEHTLVVCRGTACHTRGSKSRLEALKRIFKLKEEEGAEKVFLTTADKQFTIKTVACFGQCALAPVVEVDGKMQSHVTEVCLKELVNGLTRGGKRK